MRHSPEPWQINDSKTRILDAEGRSILLAVEVSNLSYDQVQADLALAKAAPVLLRALKHAESLMRDAGGDFLSAAEVARAAILDAEPRYEETFDTGTEMVTVSLVQYNVNEWNVRVRDGTSGNFTTFPPSGRHEAQQSARLLADTIRKTLSQEKG